MIAVAPDQFLARGLRRGFIPRLSGLVKFLSSGKNFSEWIFTNDGLPVDSVQNCFTPAMCSND